MQKTAEVISKIRQIVNRTLGRSSRERQSLRSWLEVVLLASGLALVGLYGAARVEGYLSAQAGLKAFPSEDSPAVSPPLPPMESRAFAEQGTEASKNEQGHAIIRKLLPERSAPLGVLEIPNIHLRVPLLDGTDALTLNHGVGRIAGTARPGEAGNIGIAGHRDSFFRPLKNIQAGHSIVLKTPAGVDTYVVDRFQVVSPRDVSVLRAKAKPSLTLVTCYPFYFIGNAPKRFVVTAYLTKHAAAGSTTSSPRLSTQPTNPTQEDQ
jgi:sortase A